MRFADQTICLLPVSIRSDCRRPPPWLYSATGSASEDSDDDACDEELGLGGTSAEVFQVPQCTGSANESRKSPNDFKSDVGNSILLTSHVANL